MAKKQYTYSKVLGASQNEKEGLVYAQNMINQNGITRKRNGNKNIIEFTDIDLKPLKINGIYDYFYLNDKGDSINEKIVHAGDKFFRCDSSFLSKEEITKEGTPTVKDKKSYAFLLGKSLFICGCGELLLYDGEKIKSAYRSGEAYIPVTAYGITDQENGAKITRGECQNLLTPRRINKFTGSALYFESGKTNAFMLDSNIKYSTPFVLEIKIRTNISNSEEEIQNATSYIGINEAGEEVSTIVTIRYRRDSIKETASFFLTEPIRDEEGNIINLKIGDKVYTYDKLPFAITLKNHRELRIPFEVLAPNPQEDNITVEYEVENELTTNMLNSSEHLALSNSENGKQLLLANFGDNKIYFTDKENGIFHMPLDNQISLGSDNEPVTAIIRLSDNMIGAFKKNSFYRVHFTSSNEKGYEIFHSSDNHGAYNQGSTAVVNYDCLVFNNEGVYGVSDYKSAGNVFGSLKERAFNINSYLKSHTRVEKENAQALAIDKKYYLFLGNKIYVADTRYRVNGTVSGEYSYEWWVWDSTPATCVYSDGEKIYFGTEKGEIRRFGNEYYDIDQVEYKTSDSSLLCRDEADGYTSFVLSGGYQRSDKIVSATLSPHKILLAGGVTYKNGRLLFGTSFFYGDGTSRIYDGQAVNIYNGEGIEVASEEIKDSSPVSMSAMVNQTLTEGELYDIYLNEDSSYEYEVEGLTFTARLLKNGERIKIKSEGDITLTLNYKQNIKCEYKTPPLCFDLPTKKKTLKNLYLKLPKWARGRLKIELESKKVKLQREITLAKAFDFDSLDFGNVTFDSELDILVPVPVFIRNLEYLTLKITSEDGEPFGIDTIIFEYEKKED